MVKNEPFDKKYTAKVILFGEYTVLLGGQALAVPYGKYYASWCQGSKIDYDSFAQHVRQVCIDADGIEFDEMTYNHFKTHEYFLHSTIPMGCGLGSSGSVVAAFYDNFVLRNQPFDKDIKALKSIFSQLESYFHGQSSGIDPLISFTHQPLLSSSGHIQVVDIPQNIIHYSLVNSAQPRPLHSVVDTFVTKLEDTDFKSHMLTLTSLNNAAIQHFLNKNLDLLNIHLKAISQLQFEHLAYLIPDSIKEDWEKCLNAPGSKYKLCGAGGGGYFLKMEVVGNETHINQESIQW